MTTTREDRQAALDRRLDSFNPRVGADLVAWVETGRFGEWVGQMLAEECDADARAFSAHREAAVRGERERIEKAVREASYTYTDESERFVLTGLDYMLRIVRGEPCNK